MEDSKQKNSTNNFDIQDLILMLITIMVTAFIILAPVVAFAYLYLLAQGILEIISIM